VGEWKEVRGAPDLMEELELLRPLLIFTVKSKDDQQTLSPHGCPCHLWKKTRQKKGLEGMGGDQ
jgi:hypothetical protein